LARRIAHSRNKASRQKASDGARADHMPRREEILRYIAENPASAGKREIAKAFNLKGAQRVFLKEMLRELSDEGLVEKDRKKLRRPGSLPSMAVLDITARDREGGLIARPAEWDDSTGTPPPQVAIRMPREAKGRLPGVGDRVLARIFPSRDPDGPTYTGRVVKRLDRRAQAVLGVLRQATAGEWRIQPVDRKQTELVVEPDSLGEAKANDLVEAEPVRASRYGLPRARVTAVVGSIESEKALSMIAIHAHDIPHIFPEAAIEEARRAEPAGMAGREDWRGMPLVTIDPADAKDHDDAVFAAPDVDPANPGGHVVVVAIADVAAYVRPGSALDREALKRGNSVYFPDRVVPMLPERISNDLCSLKEGVDRPAIAVRMIFDAHGRKMSHTFHRVMMKSAARLAYPQAQAAIDGSPDETTGPILDKVLRPLWDAYFSLRKERTAREPLDLDLPERKILLHPSGQVDRVIVPPRLDAHRLIEEFMIQANVAAAETLERRHQHLIYRIHDAPSLAKQESLREFLRSIDMNLARGAQLRPSQFNAILKRVEGTEHQALVNEVVLRTQSQAEYNPENIGHFGLNLRRYAHFTSPIRRYADLIVHRALIRALALGEDGLTGEEEARLEEIAATISAAERRAMAAERETVDRLVAHHLAGRIGAEFEARISGVTRSGLFVALETYGADGFVPISSLGGDYYHHDESAHSLVGERSGTGFRLGDAVAVRLVEALPVAGALRFEMLSEPHVLPGDMRSYHKARRADRTRARRAGPRGKGNRRK